MSNGVRIRVWCEDREQEAFARELLKKFGVHRRGIDVSPAPRGQGAASAWVIAQYATVRSEAQTTKHQANLGFLVMVDGDNQGVKRRIEQLHDGPDNRDGEARVAILVPTWEIETWVLWLSGQIADENSAAKPQLDADQFRKALPTAISSWDVPREGEAESVPSLGYGRAELKRLPL